VAALGTILAFGNFTSVFLPQRMRLARRGFQTTQTSAEAGCLRSLMSILTLLVMYIVLLPVAAALVLPVLFHAQWVWIASIPLSLAYGCVLYSIVTGLVAPRLLAKAPEILALVTKE
ncbi:MAG: hypothetical protein J2P36_37305, partial [Ktedonobacteraceae bacterium]|nr:hypothetical protein [Ktedonobacteraceae bacterium]